MRVVITGLCGALDVATEQWIVDPEVLRRLDGMCVPDGTCAEWLCDEIFDELDLVGGKICAHFDEQSGQLQTVTEYRAPRELTAAELKALKDDTCGHWTDGLGENGLDVELDGREICISFSVAVWESVSIVQTPEENQYEPRFVKIFRAVRNGDLAEIVAAVNAREDLTVLRGGLPPLHWAVAYAQTACALLLIEKGADVFAPDASGDVALLGCACSRDLTDSDASRIAVAMLQRGVSPSTIGEQYEKTIELAKLRGKPALARLLEAQQSVSS